MRPESCKIVVGPRGRLSKWLTCLLRGLLMMLDDCMWHSFDSTSLRLHRRLNLTVVASLLMFTPIGMVTLGRPGRGCYRVVSKYACTLFRSYLVLQISVNVLVTHACHLCVWLLHLRSTWLLHCIMLIMVVVRLP